MTTSTNKMIAYAESCFLRGKPGTFAIARTPDGKLWYAAPGVQTPVKFLSLRIYEHSFDERSFTGTLVIRANRKKEQYWFVFYNSNDKNSPYIASSADEHLDCTCTIVAMAPNIPGGSNEAIVVQAVFKNSGVMVSRIQNDDMAQALLLQAQPTNADAHEVKNSPTVTSGSNFHNQHSSDRALASMENDCDPGMSSLWGGEADDLYE